jgi:hypothetical protein
MGAKASFCDGDHIVEATAVPVSITQRLKLTRNGEGDFQMRTMTSIAAVAAVVILAGAVGWIATTTHAQAPIRSEAINPSQITLNAKNLPVEHFDDYSFVFN